MESIEIQSKTISIVKVTDLRPNPKNRNQHTTAQIDRLAAIMRYQGFRQPLTVSNRTGLIVAGHGRLLAAMKLGIESVPVMFQDFETDDQEYAAQVSDNAIAAWAEIDLPGINADIGDLGPDFDIDMLAINNFNIDVAEKLDMEEELRDDMNKKFVLEVTFPNDMEMMDIHDDLISRGYIARVKP